MFSSRTKKLVHLAREQYPSSDSSDLEPEELRRGGDPLSDDPDYSPSSNNSSTDEEVKPKKKLCQQTKNIDECSNTTKNLDEPSTTELPEATKEHDPERLSEPFDVAWSAPEGRSKVFMFEMKPTICPQMKENLTNATPTDFYHLFVDNEIIDMMVRETNRYAEQSIIQGIVEETISESSRLASWTPVDRGEMLRFLGILGYMGLVHYPDYTKYWSTDYLYPNNVCSNAMSRNRFQIILRNWHFSNNEEMYGNDRLHKLRPFTDKLQDKFRKVVTPGEVVCVDESMVPFRGRLLIKQYLPNKSHKYGIKIFKLCCNRGYTWNFKIYEGKERDVGGAVPTNIVLNLSETLLGEGRTIVTDNYYTSVELAKILLDKKTHLVGTLRKNRKHLPIEVTKGKPKKGEVIAKEDQDGILVLNWRDKREVLMLSTKHNADLAEVTTKRGIVKKPKVVIDYNEGKGHIDISDELSTYNSSLRKSLFWYKKIALELLFGTRLVNSHIVYKLATNKTITITEFKEHVVRNFVLQSSPSVERPMVVRRPRHSLERMDGDSRKVRKGCKGCKQKKSDGLIPKSKIKKIITYCNQCPEKPFYCKTCFYEVH